MYFSSAVKIKRDGTFIPKPSFLFTTFPVTTTLHLFSLSAFKLLSLGKLP